MYRSYAVLGMWVLALGLLGVARSHAPARSAGETAAAPRAPQWAYAFDLACRKLGETQFSKDTQKFGIEVYRDPNTGLGLYLSQGGELALARDFSRLEVPLKESKSPDWLMGLDLKARPAGETDFAKARVYSLEIFRDPNSQHWLLLTEKGKLAVTPVQGVPGQLQEPLWLYSMDLRCRKAGQKEWTKDTPSFGIEVYREQKTGNLIYLSETGALAVVPSKAPATPPAEAKAPQWLHGLDLHVRKFGEKFFAPTTPKVGVEIFRDAFNGNLILLTETGNLAVVPAPARDLPAPTPQPRDPRFHHGLDVRCRQIGENDFSERTRGFGIEVFHEENLGLVLYLSETGSLAAISKDITSLK